MPVRLEAKIMEEDNMKFGTLTQETKHVAALTHYQSKLHDAPPSRDNDGSAAR
jgi:hypothetical protein